MELEETKKSSGVAKAGLTLGIIGTALSSLLSLGATNNGYCGNYMQPNCNEDHLATRYDLQQAEKMMQLESELTLEKAKSSEKDNNLVLYKYVEDNFKDIRRTICDQQVENQKVADSFALTRERMDCLRNECRHEVENEAKDRRCADNLLVTYMNSTFYPKEIAKVETDGTNPDPQTVYNPLPCELCGC